jgi:hypothetical protein
MFPLNTIIAWSINIIMNKKYDNNNIIIASRAYFLQVNPCNEIEPRLHDSYISSSSFLFTDVLAFRLVYVHELGRNKNKRDIPSNPYYLSAIWMYLELKYV